MWIMISTEGMRLKSPPFYTNGGETRTNVPQVSECSIHLQPAADKLPALQIYALNDLKRQHSGYTLQTEVRLFGQFVYSAISRQGISLV